jgi:inner membrane protein
VDNISHALCGAVIARAGFEDKLDKRNGIIIGAIAANFADIDIISLPFLGRDHYMLWHGGITHSLLALLVLPPLLGWIAARISRAPLRPLIALCYLAYASHLMLDLPTSWGTMLLLPFDDTRFAAHWIYIVDLFCWFLLSLPFWMNRVVGEPVLLARFSLGALALYIGLCGVLHWQAVNVVQEAAVKKGLEVEKASAYPSPFLPIFWNGVLDDGQFLYQGPVQVPVGAEPTLPGQRLKNLKHPAVQAVLQEPMANRFVSWWADSPFAEVHCTRAAYYVVLSDLRLRSPWLPGSGFNLIWTVKYDPTSRTYDPQGYRWQTPWYGESVAEGDCLLRMDKDMAFERRQRSRP